MARTAGTWGKIETRKRNTRHGITTTYLARYQHPAATPGTRVTKSFTTKREAGAWLEREHVYVKEYERGEHDYLTPAQREAERIQQAQQQVVFSTYATQFVTNYRTADGRQLAESTARKQREALAHLLEADWADWPLDRITQTDIRRWMTSQTQGQHSLRRAWRTGRQMMRVAVETGLIGKNPFDGIRAPKLPPSQQAQIPPVTPDQYHAIRSAMPEYTRIAITLGVGLGMRMGEIVALQRQDIDLAHATITVRHGIGRGPGDKGSPRLKPTKSDTTRVVPIGTAFIPEIQAHLATRPQEPTTPVIGGTTGGFISPTTIEKHFQRARAVADRPDLHFHTTRATFATTITHQGATLAETMALTGHTAETVHALYQRVDDHTKRQAVNRLAATMVTGTRTCDQIEQEIRDTEQKLAALKQELQEAKGRRSSDGL